MGETDEQDREAFRADREYEELMERAEALGREHGTAAGTWVVDGGWSQRELANLIALDDAGDPDWWENYGPASAPLSGEWADGMTPQSLMRELEACDDGYDSGPESDEWSETIALESALCDAYEQAYYDGWRDEVLRMARYQVGES